MLGSLLAVWLAVVSAPRLERLWVWHEAWEKPPDVELSSTAPGIVLQLCSDGAFKMASGVLYRNRAGISLGSSDGLRLYKGRWSQNGSTVTLRYRLVEAEIRFTGYEEVLKKEIVVTTRLEERVLRFPFQAPEGGKVFNLRFSPAEKSVHLSDRFVECSTAH